MKFSEALLEIDQRFNVLDYQFMRKLPQEIESESITTGGHSMSFVTPNFVRLGIGYIKIDDSSEIVDVRFAHSIISDSTNYGVKVISYEEFMIILDKRVSSAEKLNQKYGKNIHAGWFLSCFTEQETDFLVSKNIPFEKAREVALALKPFRDISQIELWLDVPKEWLKVLESSKRKIKD